MRGRSAGITAFGLGIVMLAAGLVLTFLVIPGMAQFPADVDETRTYEGTLPVLLNPAALGTMDLPNLFLRDVPVTIERNVKVLEVDGGKALVVDAATLSGPAGPIQGTEDHYTIDRKTMEHVANFTDDAQVIDRQGLVVGFPIGTEEKAYTGWNGDTLATVPIEYTGSEAKHGLDLVVFRAAGGPDRIVDPEMLGTLPAALPKDVLASLVPALGLPEEQVGQLGQVLASLPDPVPLAYTYAFDKTYWVEPESGVLIDIDVMESRMVGLDLGGQFAPLTEVQRLEYTPTQGSIDDAVADAESAMRSLFWMGQVLPYGLMGLGALLALIGIPMMRRRPEPAVSPERVAV
jgi:hypothetical protein